jgi:UDP-N-acetylglucosamine/UDP-N-acetylgalactosamine diphosphorylase
LHWHWAPPLTSLLTQTGSRLGFDGPKGAFSIGLPSESSLFELFARRIARVQTLAMEWALERGVPLPPGGPSVKWIVMTSPVNHDDTVNFFDGFGSFGLSKHQVKKSTACISHIDTCI